MSKVATVAERQQKQQKHTEYERERYRNNELLQLRAAIRYYRKKKEQGADYVPKPLSKLVVYCNIHGLDAKEVIDGTQELA